MVHCLETYTLIGLTKEGRRLPTGAGVQMGHCLTIPYLSLTIVLCYMYLYCHHYPYCGLVPDACPYVCCVLFLSDAVTTFFGSLCMGMEYQVYATNVHPNCMHIYMYMYAAGSVHTWHFLSTRIDLLICVTTPALHIMA